MKELDSARQRISEKDMLFVPVAAELLQIESAFLERYPRLMAIIDEVKAEIERRAGQPLNEEVGFYFLEEQGERDNHYFPEGELRGFAHLKIAEGNYPPRHEYGDWEKKESSRRVEQYNEEWQVLRRSFNEHVEWESAPHRLGDKLQRYGADWFKEHIYKVLLYYSPNHLNPGEDPETLIGFLIKTDKGKPSWVSFRGPNEKFDHSVNLSDNGLDALVENLIRFIDRKRYVQTGKKGSQKQSTPETSTAPQDLSLLQDPGSKDLPTSGPRIRDGLDLQRRLDEEERDRVLAEIEARELEDPNYQRPPWISPEERSRRSMMGGVLSEQERFWNEDSFGAAAQRHFPQPPDHG